MALGRGLPIGTNKTDPIEEPDGLVTRASEGTGLSAKISGTMQSLKQHDRGPNIARLTLAPIFVVVGLLHLLRPALIGPYMPTRVPDPSLVILLTGVAAIAGAIGLFIPRTRALAGIMLALYAVCVFPVNIEQAVHDLSTGSGLGWGYHYPRLFIQPFICWWALVAGRVSWAPAIQRTR